MSLQAGNALFGSSICKCFSKRSIFEQIPNSNVFLVSSKPEQERRVKRQLKKKVDQFKEERVGSSFEHEKINL